VTVDVASSGATPTGTVQVRNGSSVLGTAPVSAGRATISLVAGSLRPGETTLTAVYSGDSNVAGKSVPFSQVVVKATPSVRFKVKPGTIKAGETKVRIKVKVTADGLVPVRGKVKITVEGWGTKTLKLRDGRATLKLGVIDKPGKRKVKVKFLGSALVDAAKAKGSLTVIP
jgi:5'-nucleotidase